MCLGIPGQIIEITNPEHKLAIVNIGGVKRQVNIACIVDEQHPPETCIGEWVLVHVGFAMNRINQQDAAETLQLLQEIADTQTGIEIQNSKFKIQNSKS
ncbi:HypC/HybG/HupF family hydrogenase formation chaperone [Cylindrospermum sp. FACHB-282]|uniref:HypC/HybG/HupF family hydrogenase formation chaperone n=1 Tax=Cylindrospermum sp. FACHB-282 TaxID=2692794 RepID=UPI0016826AFB|nr:HypC/HybG/HupF family hydrogenase formation chaperone [Cylindrospermum sp. FACHB-282]MBD2385300.1 HypC/HybG/HupF family hydrogenase formation chaperone [Cylindrospermum sp. FACHB-282]